MGLDAAEHPPALVAMNKLSRSSWLKEALTEQLPDQQQSWWWIGAFVTLALVAGLLLSLDFSGFSVLLADLSVPLLLIALAFLFGEATLTAIRIRMFAPTRPTLGAATSANAWYVILVLALPARMGDVAAVVVFERFLNLSRGASAISIVAQRLFDVISIAVIFLIVSIVAIDVVADGNIDANVLPIAFGLVVLITLVVANLGIVLTITSRILLGQHRPRKGLRKLLLRLSLQARLWHRQFMNPTRALAAFLISLAKWGTTMAGIAFTLMALNVPIETLQIWAASAVYNLMAIIPLHSIGGVGMGEVGLSGVLVSLGLSAGAAVGIALFVRVTLILFTVSYFAIVIAIRRLQTGHG